jgi:hypothetical protein
MIFIVNLGRKSAGEFRTTFATSRSLLGAERKVNLGEQERTGLTLLCDVRPKREHVIQRPRVNEVFCIGIICPKGHQCKKFG